MAQKLAVGPTKSYTATRTLLKAWSAGGVPAADSVLLDISMDLFNTEDDTRGFLNTAEAIDRDVEPPDLVFNNRRSAPGRPRCSSGPGRITPYSEVETWRSPRRPGISTSRRARISGRFGNSFDGC
jgi:hypothetical protein